MARTGKAPTAFFRPFTKLPHQSRGESWSSRRPPTLMHSHVHGVRAEEIGNAGGETLLELARNNDWNAPERRAQGSFASGKHTPVQFIFWSLNDISDGDQCNWIGLAGAGEKLHGPTRTIMALAPFIEVAERLIDEAVGRSKSRAIQIFCVRGATDADVPLAAVT
eukprot:8849233-Pyramimonas_sp.AAC.1